MKVFVSVVLLFMTTQLHADILLGAGATFPYPLYATMFQKYQEKTGVQVNYQAIGSGAGIRQLKNKTVDFGASDAYINREFVAEIADDYVYIPTCLSALSITYNLPGNPDINLSPQVIAEIFLGKIKHWNHKRIRAMNPGVFLPKKKIIPIQRADASGSTFIFTDFLSKRNVPFKKQVGRGKIVRWPRGISGKGNSGVTALVKQTPWSIGYVVSVYAQQNQLPSAAIENRSGNFIKPSLEAISAAGNAKVPDDALLSITDTQVENGYPIAGFTWILVNKDLSKSGLDKAGAKQLNDLLLWMVSEGQYLTEPMGYARLPEKMASMTRKNLQKLSFKGQSF